MLDEQAKSKFTSDSPSPSLSTLAFSDEVISSADIDRIFSIEAVAEIRTTVKNFGDSRITIHASDEELVKEAAVVKEALVVEDALVAKEALVADVKSLGIRNLIR